MKQKRKIPKKKNLQTKNDENDIIPQKHEKIGNVNMYSDEVAKNILELFISLTITTEFRKNTEAKLNDFIISDIIKQSNNALQLYNLNHDFDDFNNAQYVLSQKKYLKTDMDEKRQKISNHNKAKKNRNFFANRIFYNLSNDNKYQEAEVLIQNKDVEDFLNKSYKNINKIDFAKDVNIQYDIKIDKYKSNYWGDIPQPKTYFIDRTSPLYNNLNSQKNIFKKINITEKRTQKRIPTYRKKYSYYYKQKLDALKEEVDLRKKKFVQILQMPFVELPKEENKNKEGEEIQKIRKETIEIFEAKKEKLKMLQKHKFKDNQEIIKGKYTTDAKGEIVVIKEILPEELLKDFYPINSKQKELLAGKTLQEVKKESALMEKKAQKHIVFNNTHSRNSFNINQNFTINKETDKEMNNKLNVKSLAEGELEPPYNIHNKGQIILGGSNFTLINPSPGVNIKERHFVKAGPINFFQTFHKYSLEEFDKVLKDTLDYEKTKLSGNFLTNNLNNLQNNTIAKKENLGLNKNLNINKIKVQNNKKNFRKTFSETFRPKKYAQNPVKEVFTLNKRNKSNLQRIFMNDDNDINAQKPKKIEKILSANNILNREILTPNGRVSNNKKKFNLNLMDNFNKNLIMGNITYGRDDNALPILPQKNIKISKLQNNLNINGMSRTTNNFHRTRQKRFNDYIQSLSSNIIRNTNKI